MKKYLLIAGLGLTTLGVTAAVLNNGKKKTTKDTSKCCVEKAKCSRSAKTACY